MHWGSQAYHYPVRERDCLSPCTKDAYRKIAEYFKVDVNYLLTEDEEFVVQASEAVRLPWHETGKGPDSKGCPACLRAVRCLSRTRMR